MGVQVGCSESGFAGQQEPYGSNLQELTRSRTIIYIITFNHAICFVVTQHGPDCCDKMLMSLPSGEALKL
jgi:hypothetical protein